MHCSTRPTTSLPSSFGDYPPWFSEHKMLVGRSSSWLPNSVKLFTSVGMASTAASSFPPASPFRSTWKPGCSPPPPSSTWVVGSSGDEPWSILGATCSGGAVRRDGDEKREESSEGTSRKFWKLTCLCRGRRWYTWKLSARLYCSSEISTAMPVISSRDFDVHLMFLFQQNKYRLGPCYSCD